MLLGYLIKYFLDNSRLNHTILVFLLFMGIFAYIKIPKEMFPVVTLDTIDIKGSYIGASADALNNFAVREIENQIDAISGIKKVSSTVTNGSFMVTIELQDGINRYEVLNEVKDAISIAKQYLPSDMEEPVATVSQRVMSLLNVSLSSNAYDQKGLLNIAEKLKTSVFQVPHISDVQIFGDSDLQIDIMLDHKKIMAYGLNSSLIINKIKELSYIYPVAFVEQVGNHIFLTANNNKFDPEFWKETLIEADGKKIYLGDVAAVKIDYPTKDTISRFNAKPSIALLIFKDEQGDSIKVAQEVKKVLSKTQNASKDLSIDVSRDSSRPVEQRIKTILSNMTLGLILVGFSMYLLISPRLSLVIVMGIPFSFIFGLLVIEALGYSLNMISLMAMLITLGIVVDDAIIVSENIQRHLDEGADVSEAVINGTKEMIMPVMIAAFTTIFAFLPMLLISGEMGLLIKLIPLVISVLIFSSLIESFFFLPLHAKHILRKNDKLFDWSAIYNAYEKILHKTIHYKKIFLLVFYLAVPALTVFAIQESRFQMFPDMDSRNVTLSVKLDDSLSIEETDKIVKRYETLLLENKQRFYIKNINTSVGVFSDLAGTTEVIENGFTLMLELEDFKEDNILDNYINPVLSLSFDFEQKEKIRLESTQTVMQKIREFITPVVQEDKAVDFNIVSSRLHVMKTDIEIKLSSDDTRSLIEYIEKFKTKLSSIEGVKDVTDNTKMGEKEYKFILNHYGQMLGLTDSAVALALNSYFMEKEQAATFDNSGIIKIKTYSIHKDNFDELKHFPIPLGNGFVELQDVVDFTVERNFEKIEKENGKIYKSVFANVDNRIISANEVLKQIDEIVQEAKQHDIAVSFGGEREKSAQMAIDMIKAFMIAMFLIFITLLINFPSFRVSLMLISVIPFTILGAVAGHFIMGINLNSQSMIGMLGLAGVVINDGIIMLDFLHGTKKKEEFFKRAKQRVRPILITSITTVLGLMTIIFFPSGESIMLQPIAISLGFGIAWGTVLNLFYLPALYAMVFNIKD